MANRLHKKKKGRVTLWAKPTFCHITLARLPGSIRKWLLCMEHALLSIILHVLHRGFFGWFEWSSHAKDGPREQKKTEWEGARRKRENGFLLFLPPPTPPRPPPKKRVAILSRLAKLSSYQRWIWRTILLSGTTFVRINMALHYGNKKASLSMLKKIFEHAKKIKVIMKG